MAHPLVMLYLTPSFVNTYKPQHVPSIYKIEENNMAEQSEVKKYISVGLDNSSDE